MIIYKITNSVNNLIYVGLTSRLLKRRFNQHKKIGKNISCLQQAFIDLGVDNFSIYQIDSANSIAELNSKEKYWIEYYNSIYPNGYNRRSGGNIFIVSDKTKELLSKNSIGRKASKETKLLLSEMRKGNKNIMFGKNHSEKSRKQIGLNRLGKYSGENNPKTKLTWDIVNEIRSRYIPRKVSTVQLGKEYGVRHTCIVKIIHNKTWVKNS